MVLMTRKADGSPITPPHTSFLSKAFERGLLLGTSGLCLLQLPGGPVLL